ncbi:MAG: radical SAM family heme chaperone HemW [Chloroflexi bacterium]|nr:radical SAM family heme chaperone HemW [Chloroflexota bacterium]
MDGADFGVYLHMPFCVAKCRYCDFNSYAGLGGLIPDYLAALAAEMEAVASQVARGRARTLYVGGGTPSLLAADQISAMIALVRRLFALPESAEVTLEANPGTVDERYLRDIARAGVNRLSLGVQSFDDTRLRSLGRIHNAAEAVAACEAARRAGFGNLSLDLIYATPGQTVAELLADLAQVKALAPEHLSLYALQIEAGTPLAADVAAGRVEPLSADSAVDLWQAAAEALSASGYERYEVSNWARGGQEGDLLSCRHNLVYWRYEEYLGFGAGAHSYFAGRRYANVAAPREYVARISAGREAVLAEEETSPIQAARDALMLGLRLNEGVDPAEFRLRFGVDLAADCASDLLALSGLGLVVWPAARLVVTERGRLLLHEVLVRLLPELQVA